MNAFEKIKELDPVALLESSWVATDLIDVNSSNPGSIFLISLFNLLQMSEKETLLGDWHFWDVDMGPILTNDSKIPIHGIYKIAD